MPLWGNTDASSNAVKYQVLAGPTSDLGSTGANLYQNVSPNSFSSHTATGVFAVNANGMLSGKVTSPGWLLARQFCGPIASIGVNAAGGSYANLSLATISNGTVNCNFAVVVNSTGNVVSTIIANGGSDFINTSALGALVNPANGIATVTISAGGSGYANGEAIRFANGAAGSINATGTLTTNATGGITAVTFTAPGYAGRQFINTTATNVEITTVGGTGATIVVGTLGTGSGYTSNGVVTLGGRGGRITHETLVVSKYFTVTTNSALYPAT